MNLPRYPCLIKNDFYVYSFYSDGPNGRIKKTVIYSKMEDNPIVYNLAFGDENQLTGELNDRSTSNNYDTQKILSTVANTIHAFCNKHGNHYIYAVGNTSSRTRLYQMGISELWDEICIDFVVLGYRNGDWYPFKRVSITRRFW